MEYFTQPLLLALAKVTALLLPTLAVSQLIRKPTTRSILLTCVIIASPLVFVLSFTHPLLEIIPANTTSQSNNVPQSIGASIKPEDTQIAGIETEPHTSPEFNKPESSLSLPILPTVFATGVIIMLLPLLLSLWRILCLKESPASGSPLRVWNHILKSAHMKYSLHFTSSTFAPFAHGIINPKVLLPHSSAQWADRKLYATLAHEAAHLSRRDPLTRMASFVVRAILWFHPLIWIAHRQLIQAQEESCDQAALASGIAAEDYAEELLSSASLSTHMPQGVISMAKWSQIGKRINLIINQPTNNKTAMKTTLTIITTTTVVAFTIATTGLAEEVAPTNLEIKNPLDSTIQENQSANAKPSQTVDEVRKTLDTAEGYYKLGKYGEATKAFKKALKIDSYNAEARRGLEKITAAQSDYYRAADDANSAHLLEGNDAVPKKKQSLQKKQSPNAENSNEVRKLLYTGEGYYNLGKHDEATKAFKKALKIDPYNAEARRLFANVSDVRKLLHTAEGYYKLGKYGEALKEFKKASEINPDNWAVRYGRESARFLEWKNRNSQNANNLKGKDHDKLRKYEEATKGLMKALKADPYNSKALREIHRVGAQSIGYSASYDSVNGRWTWNDPAR